MKNSYIPLLVALFSIIVTSCIEELSPDEQKPELSTSVKTYQLPGILTFHALPTENYSTRDTDSPAIGSEFNDGNPNESDFAPSDDYHFCVIYSPTGNNVPVAVLPLSISKTVAQTDNSNVTLVAYSIVSASSIFTNDTNSELTTKSSIQDYLLTGTEAYLILNFDKSLIDKSLGLVSFTNSESTASVLAKIKKDDLLNNMCLTDYKIYVRDQNSKYRDYFTMTSAVFYDGAEKKYGSYSIEPENIYDSEAEVARAIDSKEYTISAYVERLAVKYTVKFLSRTGETQTLALAARATEDESGDVIPAGYDPKTGLPEYSVNINKYSGFTWTVNDGYSINYTSAPATIRIVGYGVSNLEKTEYLFRNISNLNYFTNWNKTANHRAYWSVDRNYTLDNNTKSVYPHQFRLALDTDSVVSLHGGGYKDFKVPQPEVSIPLYGSDGKPLTNEKGEQIIQDYYSELGNIDMSSINNNCVLKYQPFSAMLFSNDENSQTIPGKTFYSTENTYFDTGMKSGFNAAGGTMAWNWGRTPYTAATCLIILAELDIQEFNTDETISTQPTVYRGQNNVFYFNEYTPDNGSNIGVINSKLDIFNQVMLSGGNAVFQILHGQWDRHLRWSEEDEELYGTTHLDEVAWNMYSELWISEPLLNAQGQKQYDSSNNLITTTRKAVANDLTLIPAEISGGDGKRLIAPKEDIMGADYRYYLSPSKFEGGSEVIDDNLKVEISYNHLVALIHKIIGPIEVFTHGYMYYAVPVPHSVHSFEFDGIDPSWKTLAKIGVVRNSWYEITVNDITNIGTSVDMIDQPIVPVMDIRRSYLNMGVEVKNWHVIKQNDVPIQ